MRLRGRAHDHLDVDADEPLLFHCGQRALFPAVSRAMVRVMDPARLRWIAFSHVEADECGAPGEWLAAAPRATVPHGAIGCAIWLDDQAPRPPRALADGEGTVDGRTPFLRVGRGRPLQPGTAQAGAGKAGRDAA